MFTLFSLCCNRQNCIMHNTYTFNILKLHAGTSFKFKSLTDISGRNRKQNMKNKREWKIQGEGEKMSKRESDWLPLKLFAALKSHKTLNALKVLNKVLKTLENWQNSNQECFFFICYFLFNSKSIRISRRKWRFQIQILSLKISIKFTEN